MLARVTLFAMAAALVGAAAPVPSATVTIDTSPSGLRQVIDGFGTCIGNDIGKDPEFQKLYFDDLGCSIVRMDLTPRFVAPYSNDNYNSPWFYKSSRILTFPPDVPADEAHKGGPEKNNVRTYTGPQDYSREYGGRRAPIAVMEPNIQQNMRKLNLSENGAVAMAKAGMKRRAALGDFKLVGSLWSPAPWVKITSGDVWEGDSDIMPAKGAPYPFIWGGNFAGGSLDVSGKPLDVFNDGTGPTSALQQFARCTAAYIKGLQDANGVRFYAISIQNEINFPEFYNSCTYPLTSQYIAALKAIRAEFAKYPDLKGIRIYGPEDLLGGDGWGMWQYGAGNRPVHKNLQYLQRLSESHAMNLLDLFCIHGYAADGATAAGADPRQWRWWANGWQQAPAHGLPERVKGFTAYGKRSWMTETSGESSEWLAPAQGFPGNGGFGVALKIQQALTAGVESAWLYWQFAEADNTTPSCLTGRRERENAPKYVAAKHFFRYIRPGAVRAEARVEGAPSLSASAFIHQKDRTLTVVLVNSSAGDQEATVAVPRVPAGIRAFQAFTSQNGKLWQPSRLGPVRGRVSVRVPGYGVVTLVGQGGNDDLRSLPARAKRQASRM